MHFLLYIRALRDEEMKLATTRPALGYIVNRRSLRTTKVIETKSYSHAIIPDYHSEEGIPIPSCLASNHASSLSRKNEKTTQGLHRNAGCFQSKFSISSGVLPLNSASTSLLSLFLLSLFIQNSVAVLTMRMLDDVARFSPFPMW